MADTTSAVYGFTKPEVGGSADTWGTKHNTNIDNYDTEIARPRYPYNSPTVGATTTLDLSLARFFKFTLTQNTNVAFTNVPSSSWFVRVVLVIANGGAFTPTWPASVVWQDGVAPLLAASGTDVLEFISTDGGTTWYGSIQRTQTTLPRASVYHSVTQTPSGTALAFDTERFDNAGMHDNVTNNSRLTVPAGQGGLYHITFSANVTDDDSAGGFSVTLRKNGATSLHTASEKVAAASETATLQFSVYETLAAADYLEVLGSMSGAPNSRFGSGLTGIRFEAVKISS